MKFEQSRATIMTDLSFGDAGKGTTTEYLAHTSDSAAVIRFNGGGQAEHNIVTPDGRHHVFSQFGAGSFLPDVATHLSRDMLVSPMNMLPEGAHLESLGVHDAWSRVTVDEDAKIVTPYHQIGNRLRELARANARHGSTGQGISEAVMDDMFHPELTLRAHDILQPNLLQKLETFRNYKREQMRALGDLLQTDTPEWEALNDPSTAQWYAEVFHDWSNRLRIVPSDYLAHLALDYEHLVFEPAQGILLDEKRGFHPHTTWSNTTPDNARRQLAEIGYDGDVTTLGIVRAYTTRHGDGPFVTEGANLDAPLHEYFNGTGPWQGKFRIGHFDAVAHRYAMKCAGHLDGLVVTGIDRVEGMPEWKQATRYASMHAPDAKDYVYHDVDGSVRDIKVGQYGDKAYITRLTELMFEATPLYETRTRPTRETVIGTIEHALGMRVVLASYGPTYSDKEVRDERVIARSRALVKTA